LGFVESLRVKGALVNRKSLISYTSTWQRVFLHQLGDFVMLVSQFTTGGVVLVERRKRALPPFPAYEEQARSGEAVMDGTLL
jgi:hypothetical protein